MRTRTFVASSLLAITSVAVAGEKPQFDQQDINIHFGLRASETLTIDLLEVADGSFVAPVELGGKSTVLHIHESTVRAHNYRLLVQDATGAINEVDPGADTTFRGTLVGIPGSIVAGGMTEQGLVAGIWTDDEKRRWIEPVAARVPNAPRNLYVSYMDGDVIEGDGGCAASEAMRVQPSPPPGDPGDPLQGVALSVAELACDADYEYYLDWGSVSAVQNRISSIIASVNVQYERDVDITHTITAILVRTSEPDPYTSTDAVTLLNQFRNHWLANHGNIQRDVAQLFTGKEINSSTIGIAWLNAICSSYGFGMVQSDFNGSYSCATDLSAHELGHNWGADHCSCTSHTMNPSITCANIFNPNFTVPDITSFRDSLSCLDTGDPTGVCCLGTSCIEATASECAASGGDYRGDNTDCFGDPCAPPPPTGACCTFLVCSVETEADCVAGGGLYIGDNVSCAAGICGTQILNVASSDSSTANGSIASGSYLDTRTQNDVAEALLEEQSNGNPNRRVSRLSHVWTMEVAAGTSYVFHLDAWHDANGEGDNFVFAYSRDGSSFTNMLTVTKTADNDSEQVYAFTEDIAGTLYIRVRDTDRTQGNRNTDAVYIDHMYVLTETSGDDITPPAAPSGLGATAGDGTVALDWANNGESDVDGYTVYRSTSPGGPYTAITGIIGASDYVDNAVTNGTTYYYVVTATDLVGNESSASSEVVATPNEPGSGPTSVSVGDILVYTVNVGQGFKRGAADVLVLDNQGNPIAGAVVNGTFSGSLTGTASATTDASGVATLLTSGTKKGGVSITFCVDFIGATLPYDQSGNAETCDVN